MEGEAKCTRWDTDEGDGVMPCLLSSPSPPPSPPTAPARAARGFARCGRTPGPPLPQTRLLHAVLQGNYAVIGCPRAVNANMDLPSCSFPDKPQTVPASPQPAPQLSPLHTLGASGCKASSWGFKSHLCFPSAPPGSFARSDEETPMEVKSRFPWAHEKGEDSAG